MRLAIFDYGAGNIFSLRNSLEKAGAAVDVITRFDYNVQYDGILLPGVGNFDPAMSSIYDTRVQFDDYVGSTPVLGICLGMEMFFERSQEGKQRGLDIIGGDVLVLPDTMKVPHMGWNELEIKRPGALLAGVDDYSWVYFVHSYYIRPRSSDVITAESDYGLKVPAVIEHKNFFGTQFHPEKSGKVGQTIISNFIKECHR